MYLRIHKLPLYTLNKHLIKRTLKITGRILLGLITFIVIYFSAAYVCSRITINREQSREEKNITIYILTNGLHTDIVMPVRNEVTDWSTEVKFANTRAGDTAYNYVSMGWGDKGFYLQTPNWADLKFSVAFKAVSGLSTTAIHATFYRQMTEGARCRRIQISTPQYRELVRYINKGFQKDGGGHFVYIHTNANYGETDAFYEATGHYNLFRTCNTWANDALKSCGQKCCLWTIFDTGIFLKYIKQ